LAVYIGCEEYETLVHIMNVFIASTRRKHVTILQVVEF